MSNQSFSADLRRLCEARQTDLDATVVDVVLELGTRLVERSPVDTGLFRGNWQVGNGGPDFTKDSPVDKQPLGSAPAAGTLARWRAALEGAVAGGIVYITNNLPYGRKLEYGSSQQAPGGVVRITVAEYEQVIRQVLANRQ